MEEKNKSMSYWEAFQFRLSGIPPTLIDNIAKIFKNDRCIQKIDAAINWRMHFIQKIDRQIQETQLEHDQSFPRPCGDWIPPGAFLYLFTPHRTIARERISRLIHEKKVLMGEEEQTEKNTFESVREILQKEQQPFRSITQLIAEKEKELKRLERIESMNDEEYKKSLLFMQML